MNVLVQEFNVSHPGQVDFVAIPTNNFGLQEPGANNEILAGLEHVRPGGGFKALYKIAEKNECNGANADPLFVWLKAACLGPQGLLGDPGSFYFTPIANDDITWNFEKFLIDQEGKPYRRYTPDAYPLAQMRSDILTLLGVEETTATFEAAVQEEKQPAPQPAQKVEKTAPVKINIENEAAKPAPQHKQRQPKKFRKPSRKSLQMP